MTLFSLRFVGGGGGCCGGGGAVALLLLLPAVSTHGC